MDDALKEEVRHVLAHDLRSPLSVIITQCDLVDEGVGDLGAAMERIRRQAAKMLAMLDATADKLR